jgi:hypothetical protein
MFGMLYIGLIRRKKRRTGGDEKQHEGNIFAIVKLGILAILSRKNTNKEESSSYGYLIC